MLVKDVKVQFSTYMLKEAQAYRLTMLLLWTLVEKGMFLLKRNIQKEDEAAEKAFAGCVEALESMKTVNKDSNLPKSILKSKTSVNEKKKKVHFECKSSLTTNDHKQALHAVEKLWSLRESSYYIIAKVSSYNVTDEDLKSLAPKQWLIDQVVDAYLAFIVQAEIEKGNNITMYPSQTMTAIMNGSFRVQNTKNKLKVFECEAVVGAIIRHQHWTIVIAEPRKGVIHYYNRLQERRFQIQKCTKKLEFAERYFNQEPITEITNAELEAMRMKIATKLMMFEVFLTDHCPACGFSVKDQDTQVTCKECQRMFHKKNYCVGDENRTSDNFMCMLHVCAIQFWGENENSTQSGTKRKSNADHLKGPKILRRK